MNNIIKKKNKAIKDYKLRRGISSDFYERVAKPVTEKIGEQIKKKKKKKKQTGRTDREDDRANAGLPLPGPQIYALPAPQKKPIGYIADPDQGIDYHYH